MLFRIILFFSVMVIFGWACQLKADESRPNDAYILNENFDSNTLRWVEEYTAAHRTELSNVRARPRGLHEKESCQLQYHSPFPEFRILHQ